MRTSTTTNAEPLLEQESRRAFSVEDALREQQEMTPLERFSRTWTDNAIPAQAKYYRDLIPLEAPAAGEQYRFDVDLDRCFGCKSCVSACHHQNGLDSDETWRSVGLLIEEPTPAADRQEPPCSDPQTSGTSFQHLTTACHHCVEPACMIGCPTNAYEKDEATGIVWHLDDQCFGCQYCIMACPYQVPQYSIEKGIVRKCDMCRDRLADDEAPACVQSCPSQAIQITRVVVADLQPDSDQNKLAPGAPPSTLTVPSTRYSTRREGSLREAVTSYQPEHAHPALVAMLVLTQLSVGLLTVEFALTLFGGSSLALVLASIAFILAGLAAATAHLGRPLLAYRGILGWRTSWLSREALAFGLYTGLLSLVAATRLVITDSVSLGPAVLLGVTVLAGWLGVICSARIYQFTRRVYWAGHRSWLKFSLTAILLGCVASAPYLAFVDSPVLANALIAVAILTMLKLAHEYLCLCGDGELSAATRNLVWRNLRVTAFLRIGLAFVGGVAGPLLLAGWLTVSEAAPAPVISAISLLLASALVMGEFSERAIYFQAVAAWRMPGGMSA